MLFSKLSGFDPSNLVKLPTAERWKLEIFSSWAVLGALGCSAAAAYLFLITTRSTALAAVAATAVAICFFAIQALLNSNRGLPLGSVDEEETPPNAKQFHIVVYLLLTLAFTQPILIFASKLIDQPKINELNRLETQLRVQGLSDAHTSAQARLKRDLAKIREKINALGGNLSLYISNEEMARLDNIVPQADAPAGAVPSMNLAFAARKALVIGNTAYELPNTPLPGAIRDAKAMKAKLEKMGFTVTLLTDATRLVMEQQLVDYVNTLKPGDISFVYYSGHGTQLRGVNYLIPIDRAQSNDDYVSINKLMQMQRDKSILANIIMTDACRSGGNYETGFDSTGASRNTYIAMAAAAGEYSYDGFPNGVFTTRVLKHITDEKDIDTIFNVIKDEMARDPSVRQHPTAINFLEEPIILSVQKEPPRPVSSTPSVQSSSNKPGSRLQCTSTKITSDPEFDRQGLLNQCVSEFLKIKDDVLEDQQLATQTQSELEEKLKLRFSEDQFNPIYFFNYLWSSQVVNSPDSGTSSIKPAYRSALFSLVIWFLLAGGFVYRENQADAQNAYREFRVDEENGQLQTIYRKYSLLANEAMDAFKGKLSRSISSPSLLTPDMSVHLPDPFTDDEDVANRKNANYLTDQEAIDHLKKFLRSI